MGLKNLFYEQNASLSTNLHLSSESDCDMEEK